MMGVDKDSKGYVFFYNDAAYHSAVSVMMAAQRMLFEEATGKPLELEVTSHPRDGSKYRQDTILKLFWGKLDPLFDYPSLVSLTHRDLSRASLSCYSTNRVNIPSFTGCCIPHLFLDHEPHPGEHL